MFFVNGTETDAIKRNSVVSGNAATIVIGEGFAGAIDEIRVWARALPAPEINRDYNRYITGGENALIAYWSFNFATNDDFYDLSYKGSVYNEHDGKFNGALLDGERIPTNEQLGFKGITAADGSYSIRAIPYIGNGTVYTIIPRLGIHTFESEKEVRFIGSGSQSHTVNFIDKSSFNVSGTVTYKGGTMPVSGVSFTVDGITAMQSNGTVILTADDGTFSIQVPVGIHEVKAVKPDHIFENDGKFTDSNGQNLNYQDDRTGFKLTDNTTVRYIGRVSGGAVQGAYPLGHSLSKNNLADGIEVTLTTARVAYDISSGPVTVTETHFKPSNKSGAGWPKSNIVRYDKQKITIYPNLETGEFAASVIPEAFTVTVNAPGHGDIPGSGQQIDFSLKLQADKNVYAYTDSVIVDGNTVQRHFSDTVRFNASSNFIKRYAPTVRISQVDRSQKVLPYFGDTVHVVRNLDGTEDQIVLYHDGTYNLGMPVFEQNSVKNLKAEVFESYIFCDNTGKPKGLPNDEVPTNDASIDFTNNLARQPSSTVAADSNGVAFYRFTVTDPELTTARRTLSARVNYGDDGTSINWDGAFPAIILGAVQTGRDFVTGGPDKVLMVLRDPPGSNSYSYLEKGVTVTESSTYTGSVSNSGNETFTHNLGLELITFTGMGAGVISTTEVKNGFSIGVLHQENLVGTSSTEKVTTTTTRFQTSDDPAFVGAEADVFVGYSTNISYGSTECVNLISKARYDSSDASHYSVYTDITPLGSPWLLVKQTGIGLSESFATLFAYPQSHIENKLIPGMTALRNNFLMQPGEYDVATLQSIATAEDTVFYVSRLTPDDENFGKSNNDEVFNPEDDPDQEDAYNGPSYRVIFPERETFTRSDTILYLNQSIANWKKQLELNEKAKVEGKLIQNYSFHGGAPVEYAESYTSGSLSASEFSFMLGANYKNEIGAKTLGKGFNLTIDETVSTQHAYASGDGTENSKTKGFVLSESGDDYLSVDVLREDAKDHTTTDSTFSEKEFYTSFIFKTKAGATSCPYEGAYQTRYYKPGQITIDEATKKIEVPEIAVEKDFIENIPSGETAKFTLFLRNNSEIRQDNWFTLKMVDAANPHGARMTIDGAGVGNGREFLVPAGETLIKTLEVGKGSVMNYDDLKLALQSQCQDDIADTVSFTVHYTPSCSDIQIRKPANAWTYNTNLPVVRVNGTPQHYMEVLLDGFDVNYDSFHHIALQYKESAKSDDEWVTLMNYYNDTLLFDEAVDNGLNAAMIDPGDAGVIRYLFWMDKLPDQLYDLRAVCVCMINNVEIENPSEISRGIKDMYNPRLFGSAQPANGILTINNDIRLNFNEQIADGYLTRNNFQVTGIRNGAKTSHSVAVALDGENDDLATEFDRNFSNKDLTIEMWINTSEPQDATLFSQGNVNMSLEMGLTADNHLSVRVGDLTFTSGNTVPFEPGSWAHVALVYNKKGTLSAYYNFTEVISRVPAGTYSGTGNVVIGKSIRSGSGHFKGKIHNIRIWDKPLSSGSLQVNSLARLSGNEPGLMACYPMNEATGTVAGDIARGANLIMHGCEWSLPEGRSVAFNGIGSYLKINTGSSAVIDSTMDYTLEFWFKGEAGQTNATLLSNGRGDGLDSGGSNDQVSVEFDSNGELSFLNNGFVTSVSGDYLDNNWHHFALSVSRTIGRGQICVDGTLKGFFDASPLGGVASAFMYLGARAWYTEDNASQPIIDHFFKGEIDELRIWNLYKNETLVRVNANVKQDGGVMGLLAYYPFEDYKEFMGQQELAFSLADMKLQKFAENKVPDAVAVNAAESDDMAPVKDKGPVSDLDFDFVVNNDALIINLKESWERIEKTIVTFTVTGVRDMNGNLNISPITWSAYIDRNQLKWDETTLDLRKAVYDPMEFKVKAVNNGGSVQHFEISNMPSWMDVSPAKGTIDPESSAEITFTIDDQLNVGTYNEVALPDQ